MKKYIKPNLNIELIEIKEIIATLSDRNEQNLGYNNNDTHEWDEFWQ